VRSGSEKLLHPQQFTKRPCLERAATRSVWLFGIGNFGNVTESSLFNVFQQRCEESFLCLALRFDCAAAHPYPCLDERPDQPRPNGAPMIRTIALANAAFVTWVIAIFVRRERAQAEWTPQF